MSARHGSDVTRNLTPAGVEAEWPMPLPLESLTHWAEIDTAQLAANARAVAAHVGPQVRVMAMVKGNGYGHGALLAARAFLAGGASWLGVSAADEALQLRARGIAERVLVVSTPPVAVLAALIEADVEMAVMADDGVAAVAQASRAAGRRARVHLKIDSGMGRLGARPDSVARVVALLHEHRERVGVAGIFTHFAVADSDAEFTARQEATFAAALLRAREAFPDALVHSANSAATLAFAASHHDMVRPGIALYGHPPLDAGCASQLRPALTLRARITSVKSVEAGDTVGYGRDWTAPARRRIAAVAAGYADGIHRAQANRGSVVIAGRVAPIVGRVSMDQITVDISDCDDVAVGDVATLIGRDGDAEVKAEDAARAGSTISYEVLTAISARVPRFILNDS